MAIEINDFLKKYFGQIKVNTPINREEVLIILKKESKFDFDMELLVEFSDIKKGFIKPGFTIIKFNVDQTRELFNVNKFSMF